MFPARPGLDPATVLHQENSVPRPAWTGPATVLHRALPGSGRRAADLHKTEKNLLRRAAIKYESSFSGNNATLWHSLTPGPGIAGQQGRLTRPGGRYKHFLLCSLHKLSILISKLFLRLGSNNQSDCNTASTWLTVSCSALTEA